MLKVTDRIFGWLLVLGSIGHTIGTLKLIAPGTGMFVWSLGSALAAALLGALNIVRAGRPNDKTLAAITLVGTGCWFFVAFGFGRSIGHLLDPRPLSHMLISFALVIFSAITLARTAPSGQSAITTAA